MKSINPGEPTGGEQQNERNQRNIRAIIEFAAARHDDAERTAAAIDALAKEAPAELGRLRRQLEILEQGGHPDVDEEESLCASLVDDEVWETDLIDGHSPLYQAISDSSRARLLKDTLRESRSHNAAWIELALHLTNCDASGGDTTTTLTGGA